MGLEETKQSEKTIKPNSKNYFTINLAPLGDIFSALYKKIIAFEDKEEGDCLLDDVPEKDHEFFLDCFYYFLKSSASQLRVRLSNGEFKELLFDARGGELVLDFDAMDKDAFYALRSSKN